MRAAWDHLSLQVKGADEVFGAGYEQQARKEWESSMRISLPLLLYLASQEPDVRHRRDHERRPERRRPERDGGGPNWWEVGYRIGAALRSRPELDPDEATGGGRGGAGRTPAPQVSYLDVAAATLLVSAATDLHRVRHFAARVLRAPELAPSRS